MADSAAMQAPENEVTDLSTTTSSLLDTPVCWMCNSKLVPHPLRHSKVIVFDSSRGLVDRRHPFPEYSYQCNHCCDSGETTPGMAVLLCAECNAGMCEWFYSLGETWEDVEICRECNVPLCQNCYYARHKHQ